MAEGMLLFPGLVKVTDSSLGLSIEFECSQAVCTCKQLVYAALYSIVSGHRIMVAGNGA